MRQKEAERRQRPNSGAQSQCQAPCTDFFHGGRSSQDSSRKQVLVSGGLLSVVTQSNPSDALPVLGEELDPGVSCTPWTAGFYLWMLCGS